jgi:hypothetical protein
VCITTVHYSAHTSKVNPTITTHQTQEFFEAPPPPPPDTPIQSQCEDPIYNNTKVPIRKLIPQIPYSTSRIPKCHKTQTELPKAQVRLPSPTLRRHRSAGFRLSVSYGYEFAANQPESSQSRLSFRSSAPRPPNPSHLRIGTPDHLAHEAARRPSQVPRLCALNQ